MAEIDFTDYNRISDVLMYFTSTLTLNFTVSLSKKNQLGQRQFFQYETEYQSDYVGGGPLRSIKRNMNFYFTIDNREVFAGGMILRAQDVEMLMMLIQEKVLPWFFGGSKEYAFQIIENKLVLKEFEPVFYTQSDNKYLKFEPIVYSFEDGTFTQGVQMSLASGDVAPMELDKFMGFIHLLRSDMYAVACNMVNYVKIPPYGVNEFKVAGLGTGKQRDNWGPDNNLDNRRTGKQPRTNSFLDSK